MKPIIHGDIDLIPSDKLPENLIKVPFNGSYILRHGESGHKHVLTAEPTSVNIWLDSATNLHVLEVKKPTQITHEEHKTITIEPGIFIEKVEKEYNPFEKQLQVVID